MLITADSPAMPEAHDTQSHWIFGDQHQGANDDEHGADYDLHGAVVAAALWHHADQHVGAWLRATKFYPRSGPRRR
jgi:hypothetical protein